MSMESCPDRQQLENFLADELSAEDLKQIETHIDTCEPCQQVLDSVCAESPLQPLSEEREKFDTAEAEQLKQALEEIKENPPVENEEDSNKTAPYYPSAEDWPKLKNYRILDKLGKGGMGVVYKAQHLGLDRIVALKMIKTGGDAEKADLLRFRTEAEAVARMQHPNIVQAFEVGEHDGMPFLSLEYCEGGDLGKQLKKKPPTPQEAAELVETLARAMHAAHQRMVIHRDLKPANVLLSVVSGPLSVAGAAEDQPRTKHQAPRTIPKITDFGLAKKLDQEAGQSEKGVVMGTASYMAPEQARGETQDLGPAVDIYALGAILYQCLTGRPPFKADTNWKTVQQVIDNDPIPPRQLRPKTPRDLETICLKCLHKEPGRRYASAHELADDLRRWLDKKPIQARPVGQIEKMWLWCKRRPAVAVSAAAITLLVVGAISFATVELLRAVEERQQLQVTTIRIRSDLTDANNTLQQLTQRLRKPGGIRPLLDNPAEWEVKIQKARSAYERAMALSDENKGAIPPVLRSELERLEALLKFHETDQQFALQLEETRLEAAVIVDGQFNYPRVIEKYEKLFQSQGLDVNKAEADEIAARISKSAIKEQLVAALDDWAIALTMTKNRTRRRILEVVRLADPDPLRVKLRDPKLRRTPQGASLLVEEIEKKREKLAALPPQTLMLIGYLYPANGDGKRVNWLRYVQSLHPSDFWLNFELADTLRKSQPLEAISFYRAALAIRPRSVVVNFNLGSTLAKMKDQKRAVIHFKKVIQVAPAFAKAYVNLGFVLKSQSDAKDIMELYKRAIQLDPKDAMAHNNLGFCLYVQGDLRQATTYYKKAIQFDPRLARAHCNLGRALHDQKDFKTASKHYQQAIQLDSKFAEAYCRLAITLQAQNNWKDAVTHYRKAIELDSTSPEFHHVFGIGLAKHNDLKGAIEYYLKSIQLDSKTAVVYVSLGNALNAQGDRKGAIKNYQTAINIDPKHADAHYNLGKVLYDLKNLKNAIEHYRKAIRFDPEYAEAHCNLGVALKGQGDWIGAITHYKKAIDLNPKDDIAITNLGAVLYATNELTGAIAQYKKAIGLNPTNPFAHASLGLALKDMGRFDEATATLKQALELLQKNHPARRRMNGDYAKCVRLQILARKLPAALKGKKTYFRELLDLGNLCARYLERYRDAARLYAEAFIANPLLEISLRTPYRLHAARAAAMAAAGKGKNANEIDKKARAELRHQALKWLGAELQIMTSSLNADQKTAISIQKRLEQVQQDDEVSSVRDDQHLAALPEPERKEWQKLWSDATALRKKARDSYTETKIEGALIGGTSEQSHPLKMTAGRTYIIDMQSLQFDTFLRLHDANGKKLAENDDIDSNRKILNSRVVFTPKKDGAYHLIASSFERRGRGNYEIVVREFTSRKP